MKELKVLAEIAATTSTKEKQALLSSCDTPQMRTLLELCYNPYKTYGVQQLDMPDTYNVVQPDITVELRELLEGLMKRSSTPTQSRAMIRQLLSKCTEQDAEWVTKIIRKDLKAGISATTINKAFPGLVPVFGVQLAKPMVEPKTGKSRWETLEYPVIVEEKYDGMRVVAICDGYSVIFYSRDGIELPHLQYLAPQILALRAGTKFVLDGEVIGINDVCPKCKPAVKAQKAGKHWEFAQGLSMAKGSDYSDSERKQYLGFMVWDVIDYDYFTSGGNQGRNLTTKQRKLELTSLFERTDRDTPNLIHVENRVCHSQAEIIAYLQEVLAKGGEGLIVKKINSFYAFDRTDDNLKVKEFKTADLRVTGAFEGKPGTKYEGMLGGVVVSDGDITAEVGSGFSDDERVEFWYRFKRGDLVGVIFEILYFEITPDNSLRLPVFIRERTDKTECSWN